MGAAVTILDGGLSTALEEAGHRVDGALWTARLVVEDPDAVVAAHAAYIRAGAEIIITASYQASVAGFTTLGLLPHQVESALRATTRLARRAAHQAATEDRSRPVRVAASVGPYGAVLADGSEYSGRYDIDETALARFHTERLGLLVDTSPDLLAAETIPSVAEARSLIAATTAVGSTIPTWVSFCCRSGHELASGEPIEAAVAAVLPLPNLVAVGVNCTASQHVSALLGRIRAVTMLPLVAYPNAGRTWSATADRWIGPDRGAHLAEVDRWVELGARLVGGCCGVGPAEIATLARHFHPTRLRS